MTEDMRNLWTLSAPVTSEYNSAMKDFTDLTYITSPQHKDLTEARIKRDGSDLEKIRTKLAACSPFTSDPTLRNIVNGIVAGPDGNKIIEYIIGKSALLTNSSGKTEPKPLGISLLSRLLLIVPLIMPFCTSVSLCCEGQEIFQLKKF